MEKKYVYLIYKYQKIYLTYYNLLIAQNLLQFLYEILLIIFQREFIKLNVNTDMAIKYVGLAELKL